MNQQDQQAIEELFQFLYKSAEQAGPRDPQAEALIQQRFEQGPPGLLYQMAQTLVAQRYALEQARAQLAARQQPSGAPAGFAPPGQQAVAQPAYQPPPWQQPAGQQPAGPPARHGFLAGAGKIALGVGGGILGAEALRDLFGGGGGGGLFGGDADDYNRDRDYGFGGQDDWGARDDYVGQDNYAAQDNYGAQDDYGAQDPGDGGFGGDDGGGW